VSLLIFLYHFLLLQTLDCHYSAILLLSTESHLPEGSSAYNADAFKIFLTDFLSAFTEVLHLLGDNVFLGVFALLDGEVQLSHLFFEGFPIFATLFFSQFCEVVFLFDVALDLLGLLPRGLADRHFLHY
jgi:hypothetical protein